MSRATYSWWRARLGNYGLTVPTHIETRTAVGIMLLHLVVESRDPWPAMSLLMQTRKDFDEGVDDGPPKQPGRLALVRAWWFYSRVSWSCLRRALKPARDVASSPEGRH